MSDQKDQKGGREYSVDEILAEYGSKRTGAKVVDFPEQKGESAEEDRLERTLRFPAAGRTAPKPPAKDEPIPEIVPESVGRSIGARVHTLLRKADHYADHMYDQAEPDEAARRAEKYTPGVDREEVPDEEEAPPRRPRLRLVRPRELPPDTAPSRLAMLYGKGIKGQGRRVRLALLLGLAAAVCSVGLPFLPWGALGAALHAWHKSS